MPSHSSKVKKYPKRKTRLTNLYFVNSLLLKVTALVILKV